MKARLTRVKAGYEGHALRTDIMEGEVYGPPLVSRRFEIWNDEPLYEGTHRYIITSPVAEFSAITGEFTTQSGSQYLFEELT